MEYVLSLTEEECGSVCSVIIYSNEDKLTLVEKGDFIRQKLERLAGLEGTTGLISSHTVNPDGSLVVIFSNYAQNVENN